MLCCIIFTFISCGETSKSPTASFNDAIKDRHLIYRFPYKGECHRSLLFYPITETKGNAYLLDLDFEMKNYSRWHSYRFSYTISNDEIFLVDGKSFEKNYYGEYNRFEDTVLKIIYNDAKIIELQAMPNGPNAIEYFWFTNIDDVKERL